MIDYARLRQNMVETQVMPNDVTDRRILRAMRDVPRERFVPGPKAMVAYMDSEIEVIPSVRGANGRSLVSPMLVGKLLQAASLEPGERVLEIGCATGYLSAVAAHIAGEVVGLEDNPELVKVARAVTAELGLANVQIVEGPLAAGFAAGEPFDVILLNGQIPEIPKELFQQLTPGGRILAIVGSSQLARAMIGTYIGGSSTIRGLFDASARPLPGFERRLEFQF